MGTALRRCGVVERAPCSLDHVFSIRNTHTGPNYSDGLMYLLTRVFSTHQRPTDVNSYNIADPAMTQEVWQGYK